VRSRTAPGHKAEGMGPFLIATIVDKNNEGKTSFNVEWEDNLL
jgi:hypothetical protein